MNWIILFLAGLLEVVWAVGLKYTRGFTLLIPSVITITAMIGSMALLATAVKNLPIGTAYAVWTGIGTIGTVLWGIFYLGEPKDGLRLFFILLVLIGILGLKFVTKQS